MDSVLQIFGLSIPLYGIFYFSGIFIAVLAAVLLAKKEIFRYDIVYSAVYTAISGVIGAKLLFLLVSWKQIIALQLPLMLLLKGGFVFYGGLFGGFAGLWIYCRQFHLPFWTFADLYAAVLPLGHAIGRIGCHFAGCCYGIPYDGAFSVTYHSTLGNTPLETPLLPVQLIESFCLFLLFVSLSLFYHNKKLSSKKGQISGLYSLSYAMVRILLECLRGDRVRGMFLGISTSQWISFALLFLGVFLLFRKAKAQTSFS